MVTEFRDRPGDVPPDNLSNNNVSFIHQPPEVPLAEECEAQIISIVMQNPDELETALSRLKPEHFYFKYRPAWVAIVDLLETNGYPTAEVLRDKLKQMGEPVLADELGSLVVHGDTYSANIDYYIGRVRGAYRDRQLQNAGGKLAGLANRGDATIEEYQEILDRAQETLAATHTLHGLLPCYDAGDMEDLPPQDYLVSQLLVERDDNILVVNTQYGKTTLAEDLSEHISRDMDWHGHKVKGGHVFYICAEGQGSAGKRHKAWRLYHKLPKNRRLHIIPTAVNLLDPDQVRKLIETMYAMLPEGERVALIVIDTLSRCTAGKNLYTDEFGSAAMMVIQRLREEFDTTSLILAHPGHVDNGKVRGWSGFGQWAGNQLAIDLEGAADHLADGVVMSVSCTKMKEDERPDPVRLVAHQVELDTCYEDGRPHSALVLDSADGIPVAQSTKTAASEVHAANLLKMVRELPKQIRADLCRNFMKTYTTSESSFDRAYSLLKKAGNIDTIDGLIVAIDE